MKVILTKDVPGLGRSGDVKEVSDGHARNYLIPKHLVLPATTSELRKIQKEEQEHQAKVEKERVLAGQLRQKLQSMTFEVTGKSSKQTLFAAITQKQIAEAINKKLNLRIEPQQITINQPIKTLGESLVEVRLQDFSHAQVKIQVKAA